MHYAVKRLEHREICILKREMRTRTRILLTIVSQTLGHCAAHGVPTRPENANLVGDGNGGLVLVQPELQRGQEKRAFLSNSPFLATRGFASGVSWSKAGKKGSAILPNFHRLRLAWSYDWAKLRIHDRRRFPALCPRCKCIMARELVLERGISETLLISGSLRISQSELSPLTREACCP